MWLFNDSIYFSIPRRAEIHLDPAAFLFAAGAALFIGALLSLLPVIEISGPDIYGLSWRSSGKASSELGTLRRVLLAMEVGVAILLCIGAGLFLRSERNLSSVDPGFTSQGILSAAISLAEPRPIDFYESLLRRASLIPGVQSVAAIDHLPLSGISSIWSVSKPSRQQAQPLLAAVHHVVTPGYFSTLGIHLLRGRMLLESDSSNTQRVTVISQTAAHRYFPGEDPIGRQLRIEDQQQAIWRIVGIVNDVRNLRMDLAPKPEVYVPFAQSPAKTMTVLLRVSGSPASFAPALRTVLRQMSKSQTLSNVQAVDQLVADSTARWRVASLLITIFACAVLFTALIGINGMTSHIVASRAKESAIRLILGAQRHEVFRLLLKSTMLTTLAGILAGIASASMLTRFLTSLFYDVGPLDTATFCLVPLGALLMTAFSCSLAAWRALSLEPSLALRSE